MGDVDDPRLGKTRQDNAFHRSDKRTFMSEVRRYRDDTAGRERGGHHVLRRRDATTVLHERGRVSPVLFL